MKNRLLSFLSLNYGDDAEQVTNPAPNQIKLNSYGRKTLIVLEAGHYRETVGKRGFWFTTKDDDSKIFRIHEWNVNRRQVTALYDIIKRDYLSNLDVIVADTDWNEQTQDYEFVSAKQYHNDKGVEKLYYRRDRLNKIYLENRKKYSNIIFLSVHHNAYNIFSGKSTLEIQKFLNSKNNSLIEDGVMGPKTRTAMNYYLQEGINDENTVSGTEVYYHGLGKNYKSKTLAQFIVAAFKRNSLHLRPYPYRPDTMIYKSGFYILRRTLFPVKILLELGYMTNRGDAWDMNDSKVIYNKAKAIYEGIKNYLLL